ncbi:hypothetical protein F2P45_18900 [Massilia sp. CCM 8733]|uniref:Uncharacterized protein n=1 Tax=Massilia mucilaginosa TaxID=2609282 RepID=A0ABX0NWG4_9BURK|nr:hypothetical protein [Massilia mucilaginosa]NHZ91069.1 hypothetical protein [Massilia mucilaginosa]
MSTRTLRAHTPITEESRLSQPFRAGNRAFFPCILPAIALAVALPGIASGAAAPSRKAAADVGTELRLLAQQRPWTCADQPATPAPGPGLTGGVAECAWQNRLRMRRWSGQGGVAPGACVSAQAHWWGWARAGAAPSANVAPVWRSAWNSQAVSGGQGAQQRIVTLRRQDDGQWSVTEWRWDPSERAATRRWQEQRWALLAASAARWRSPAEPPSGPVGERMLHSVLEAHLAQRTGEIGERTWQWQAERLCLTVDAVGLGQQLMQLPYAADDSRMEQRAAMQLQLARRYPKATWLTPFSLVPKAPHARGGAKFLAVWMENATFKGQLWIPTRGGGPLVRLRITTVPPAGAHGAARAEQVLQNELTALATRWAAEHE